LSELELIIDLSIIHSFDVCYSYIHPTYVSYGHPLLSSSRIPEFPSHVLMTMNTLLSPHHRGPPVPQIPQNTNEVNSVTNGV